MTRRDSESRGLSDVYKDAHRSHAAFTGAPAANDTHAGACDFSVLLSGDLPTASQDAVEDEKSLIRQGSKNVSLG